jgi:hypothetical protein
MVEEPVTIEQVKTHLRLELADTGEDDYLQLLTTAARRSIENRTGQTVAATWPDVEGSDAKVMGMAVLLLVGSWYTNREAVVTSGATPSELPLAVEYLLAPLRRFVC